MSIPAPSSFREFVGSIGLTFAIVFSLVALLVPVRELSLRVAGIGFILCLALFANQWSVYFAAVFIVATGITSLDFLENLAAIVRGSKEYFDYRKSVQQPGSPSLSPGGRDSLMGLPALGKQQIDGHEVVHRASILAKPTEQSTAAEAPAAGPAGAAALAISAEEHRLQGRLTDAVRDASEALAIEPKNVFALRTYAEACRGLGRFDDAVRGASEALAIEPKNTVALQTRAEAYRGLGRFDDAVRDASEALAIEPKNAFALRTRAEAYRGLGRFDDAIRDAGRALDLEPGNQFAVNTIARAQRRSAG